VLIIVYQTNTGHRAVSLYNESNAQTIYIQMLNLSCFYRCELTLKFLRFAIFADLLLAYACFVYCGKARTITTHESHQMHSEALA